MITIDNNQGLEAVETGRIQGSTQKKVLTREPGVYTIEPISACAALAESLADDVD